MDQAIDTTPDAAAATPDLPAAEPCFDPEANLGAVDSKGDGTQETRRDSVVRKVIARFEDYKNSVARTNAERQWNLAYKLVMGWRMTNDPDEIVLREVWRQVETMLPQFKGLTNGDFSFKARVAGAEKMAAACTAIVKDQLQRYGSLKHQRAAIKNMVQYGNAYLVPTWSTFKRTEFKLRSMHSDDGDTSWDRETSEVIEDGPCLRHVQMWNVFTHPRVTEAKNSPAVFVVEGMSTDALKTMVREGYLDADATEKCIDAMMESYLAENWQGRYAQDPNNANDIRQAMGEDALHEYMTCWTADGWEYVVVDQKFLLRAQKLQDGKIPIVTLSMFPMAEEHYSEGLPIKLASEQRIVNQLMSDLVKQSGFSSNPVLKLKKSSTTRQEWKNLKVAPGAKLDVDSMDDAAYLEYPTGTIGLIQNTIGFVQSHQKDETGITDRLSGLGDNQGTATGAVKLSAAATSRIEYIVEGLIPDFQEMYQWIYNLDARHLNRVYAVRVASDDGEKFVDQYKPEVFIPDVDVEVAIGAATGPEQVNTWMQVLKAVGQLPGINVLAIADKLFAAAGETKFDTFHTSGPNQQGDAMAETMQVMTSGIIAEPKPSDDHQTHLGIHTMAMNTPGFMALSPAWQQALKMHSATHQAYLQQQQQQNAQMQQQQIQQMGGGQGPGGGATQVQQGANNTANAMFNMGATGAAQQGAA